jgi:hypothetical protein
LQLLAKHPVFRKNESLHQFLDTKELPATITAKKGWVQSLTHAVEEVRLHGRKDVDEFFGGQRSFVTESAVRLKEANVALERMLRSQCAVSTAIGQMNSNLSLTASSLSANDPILYRVLLKFSEGIDTIKSSVESATQSDDLSLGVTLNLYEKYTLKAKVCTGLITFSTAI